MERSILRAARMAPFYLAIAVGPAAAQVPGVDPPEPIVFRLSHPDRQLEAILKFFEGSRTPHPAAALAAWKRASREPDRLGKRTEAVISFFNPEMIREWRTFHDATLEVGTAADAPGLRWRFRVPNDDGSLEGLITALRLSTDGPKATDLPGTRDVEPLGPGGAVAMRGLNVLLFASSREALERGARSGLGAAQVEAEPSDDRTGLHVRIEPARLSVPAAATVTTRRLIALGQGLGCGRIDGRLFVEGERLALEATSTLRPSGARVPGKRATTIEPDWLARIPAGSAAALLSLAAEQGPTYWDRLLALADRIDRADPGRANLAPLRVRLNLVAVAAGARLEADLWPHLVGLTAAVLVDPARPGAPGGVLLCLHLDDVAAAGRIRDELLPRLMGLRSRGKSQPAEKLDDRAEARRLGLVEGRPVEALVDGSTVVIGWGEGILAVAERTAARPEGSVRSLIAHRRVAEGAPLARVGLFWPGRLRLPVDGLDGVSPLARSLADGPPVVWTGGSNGDRAFDRLEWNELSGLVRRFLDAIPQDPSLVP